jgi:hypothetical protein
MRNANYISLGLLTAFALLAPSKESYAGDAKSGLSSAGQVPAVTQRGPQVLANACLISDADKSVTLQKDKVDVVVEDKSASYSTPNCKSFVVDFSAPAGAAPGGFTGDFNLGGTIDASIIKKTSCGDVKGTIAVYKKETNGTFSQLGKGDLKGKWHEPCTTGFCPDQGCVVESTMSKAQGKVPSAGSQVYRVVVAGHIGALPLAVSAFAGFVAPPPS